MRHGRRMRRTTRRRTMTGRTLAAVSEGDVGGNIFEK